MEEIRRSKNFLVVSIIPQRVSDEDAFKDLKETKELIDTYGGKIKEFVIQRREVHARGMFIGWGKVQEIASLVSELQVDIVVLNAIVRPAHIYEIKKQLEEHHPRIQVWDRVDLILEIFAEHAHTAEAKLQIELAAMRHMGPRIYGMGYVLSRQGGGIGTLGIGETNTELMKRHWRTQIKKVNEKLQRHAVDREHQLEQRSKKGLQTVSIIGYTNAGKTSLFNTLTGKKNSVQNALFVTLDSSVGKLFLPRTKKEILLTDTIGFIRNLPTSLIDAFRSTLMESIHADLLLFVIDVTDADMQQKIDVVEEILWSLRLEKKQRLYVFNKIDAADHIDKEGIQKEYDEYQPQFISVKKGIGIDRLLQSVEESLTVHKELIGNVIKEAPRKKGIHV
ncbi:MAG: GTPase HflX [Candidatus Levybacteria bacterium]|nr:GTPase HflX [Candidatus Levybacteria bacterium]